MRFRNKFGMTENFPLIMQMTQIFYLRNQRYLRAKTNHAVMLNSFQHLIKKTMLDEIPKQVRDDGKLPADYANDTDFLSAKSGIFTGEDIAV